MIANFSLGRGNIEIVEGLIHIIENCLSLLRLRLVCLLALNERKEGILSKSFGLLFTFSSTPRFSSYEASSSGGKVPKKIKVFVPKLLRYLSPFTTVEELSRNFRRHKEVKSRDDERRYLRKD